MEGASLLSSVVVDSGTFGAQGGAIFVHTVPCAEFHKTTSKIAVTEYGDVLSVQLSTVRLEHHGYIQTIVHERFIAYHSSSACSNTLANDCFEHFVALVPLSVGGLYACCG